MEMEVTHANEVEHAIISKEADLIVYSNPKQLCYVSSKILSSVSPVFRAMLGPSFAEGHALRQAQGGVLPMIHLQDDHDVALHCVCSMLHHNSIEQLHTDHIQSTDIVRKVACLADKYDCISAIKPLSLTIFKMFDSPSMRHACGNSQYSDLIYAAYLFDDPGCFQKYTNLLIKNDGCQDPRVYGGVPGLQELPKLMERRSGACRFELSSRSSGFANSLAVLLVRKYEHPVINIGNAAGSTRKCDYHQRITARYLELLAEEKLWPALCLRQEPLSVILRKIDNLAHPDISDIAPCEEACACKLARLRQHIDPKLRELKEHAQNLWAGLCLDCFKDARVYGRAKANCRIPHESFSLERDEFAGADILRYFQPQRTISD